jgi:hypothetical protein
MNNFEDLQEVAKGAHKGAIPVIAKRMGLLYFVAFPVGILLLYPPVFGLTGWGILGGIAGLFMSLTIIQAVLEIKFIVKEV